MLAVLDTYLIELLYENYFGKTFILGTLLEYPSLFQTGIFLSGFLILIILTRKTESREILLFLWLIYILMTGTSQITYFDVSTTLFGMEIDPSITNMLAKLLLSLIVVVGLILVIRNKFSSDEIKSWFTETKFFIRSIFPLVITGVIIAGFIKFFIPPELVAGIVGRNTVLANLVGVLFGVFMYFPTLMEVPIAKIFLELGMAKGPLLAYLLADPELSIQSILVTRKYLGDKKNTVFILLVTLFTTIAGLLFGLFLGQNISLW
jgi:uncharacterized membrane protein YraQ (UPF0718 family)